MKTTLALSLLLFTSSALAAVIGNGVTRNVGDADSCTCTLEFLTVTLK